LSGGDDGGDGGDGDDDGGGGKVQSPDTTDGTEKTKEFYRHRCRVTLKLQISVHYYLIYAYDNIDFYTIVKISKIIIIIQ